MVGYNPHKPCRSAREYYKLSSVGTEAGSRRVGGQPEPCQAHATGLVRILNGLASQQRPQLVRADVGKAGEPISKALEDRGQNYLAS